MVTHDWIEKFIDIKRQNRHNKLHQCHFSTIHFRFDKMTTKREQNYISYLSKYIKYTLHLQIVVKLKRPFVLIRVNQKDNNHLLFETIKLTWNLQNEMMIQTNQATIIKHFKQFRFQQNFLERNCSIVQKR